MMPVQRLPLVQVELSRPGFIAADRRNQRRRGADLREMRGDVERSAAGLFTGGETIPQDFAESEEVDVHDPVRVATACGAHRTIEVSSRPGKFIHQ